jgi:hypothetical protein
LTSLFPEIRMMALPFYSEIGVRELLIVNRQVWALDFFRHQDGDLRKVGESNLEKPEVLASAKLPVDTRPTAAAGRSPAQDQRRAMGRVREPEITRPRVQRTIRRG